MIFSRSPGQAAIEYLTVFGIALALSTPFILKAQSSMLELQQGSGAIAMSNSMQEMESAIEMVSASGEPAQLTFFIQVPESFESSTLNESEDAIIYSLRSSSGKSQMVKTFDTNITGEVPAGAGRHKITVIAKQDAVEIDVVG